MTQMTQQRYPTVIRARAPARNGVYLRTVICVIPSPRTARSIAQVIDSTRYGGGGLKFGALPAPKPVMGLRSQKLENLL